MGVVLQKRDGIMEVTRVMLLACGSLSIIACSDPSSPRPADQSVSLSIAAAAYRVQELAPQRASMHTMNSNPSASGAKMATFASAQDQDILAGELDVTNMATGEEQDFPWSVTIDPDLLTVTSNRTIILPPGNYRFSLLLGTGNQQYAGTVLADVGDGNNRIAMAIRPIIGDTILDVRVVEELGEFRLAYDPEELGVLADPKIGILLDGAPETIFQLSPTTGTISDYIHLSDAIHSIKLRLYDGNEQVGKSLENQETQRISAGMNVNMDLRALAATTAFHLYEAGGDAQFSFVIPAEVVEEAGGLDHLEARVSLAGDNNPFQDQVLTLSPGSTQFFYVATATFSNMQYGMVNASLTFTDVSVSPIELLGSCVQSITLDHDGSTDLCNVTLRRRAVIGGRLLATVGINVFDASGEPISGAMVRSDGLLIGITNNDFGSAGYLQALLPAGPHTLDATADTRQGSITVDLLPLSLNNIDIHL